MNVEHNNKLNETEIICPSELSLDDKNTYNDSILKSLKESQYLLSNNKSNILLNSLKEFSNRYDLDDRKIMKSKKFLISFNDLITIVKFALEFQIKINNSLNEYLNEISQDFINNLSYYIFSFEKVDISKQNDYYTNYNTYNSVYSENNKKTTIYNKNIKSDEEKQNINRNKKIKVNNNNRKNISANRSLYLNIKSPKNKKEKNKINENEINKSRRNNKSVEKRSKSNADFILNMSKNQENHKKNINKSTDKRKNIKEKDLNKNRNTNSFSIFTVCENLKNSSFIIKTSKTRKASCIEQNNNNKNKKNTYYNQYQNIGIKKQILGNNIIRPSNMANKLLQKGIKYINDFANLKEEENKKKY